MQRRWECTLTFIKQKSNFSPLYLVTACVWVFYPCILGTGAGMAQGSSKRFLLFQQKSLWAISFGCFTSHCLGQGFETCPLINEHPIQARPPSFVPSLLDCMALLEAMLVESWRAVVKKKGGSGQWKPEWTCISFIFTKGKAAGAGW